MANSLLTPSMIAKESLVHLKNNLVFGRNVHRDYKKEFAKVGDTVSIRRPVKFTATTGATRSNQDITEGNTSITVGTQKHVSWSYTAADMTLSIEEVSKRYIEPAMITLANDVDQSLAALYKDVWNWVGTPGQTLNSFADFSKGPQRLDEMAVMAEMRSAMLSPADNYGMLNNLTSLQAPSKVVGAYEAARLGRVANADVYSSQNVQTHTVGAHAGTPLVNGGSQNDTYADTKATNESSLVTDGWSTSITGVLKKGDVFTIANVSAVNPVTKAPLPYLQQFVVKADANSDGSGNATLTVSPAIISSGAYQTVSATPADNAAITVLGTASTGYASNLLFHRNALALVMCPLEPPIGGAEAATETMDGFSVRVVRDYDISEDNNIIRLDILYGVKAIYPDLATRMSGTA
jgi:hypothetical protein